MDLVGGGVDSRGSYVSKILYVKTKELGPLGEGRAPGTPPLDPPMVNVHTDQVETIHSHLMFPPKLQ